MRERPVREAVVREALNLEVVRIARGRAHGVGPVRDTDRALDGALLDVGVERSRGAVQVRQAPARDALARGYRRRCRAGAWRPAQRNDAECDKSREVPHESWTEVHERGTYRYGRLDGHPEAAAPRQVRPLTVSES